MEDNDAARTKKPPAQRGLKLVLAVYNELLQYAERDFTTAELLKAAQQLIDLSKSEYSEPNHDVRVGSSHYFAKDTFTVLSTMPWNTLSVETRINSGHKEEDDLAPEKQQELKMLLNGNDENMWEF